MNITNIKKAACFAASFVLAAAMLAVFTVPAAASDIELPSSFDLRNVDTDGDGEADACYVTPVKMQNPFGTCWGFAAIASAETSILSSGLAAQDGYAAYADPEKGLKELNLSEKHLVYFLKQPIEDPRDPQYGEGYYPPEGMSPSEYLGNGGFPFYATSLFASGTGPVLEDLSEDLEYHGKNKNIQIKYGRDYCYSADDDWSLGSENRFVQSYVLKGSYMPRIPSLFEGEDKFAAIREINELIYTGHGVQIGFHAETSTPKDENTGRDYLNEENWCHYTYDDSWANHAVCIIGWDDNYPRENFAHKNSSGEDVPLPEGDGAWLVKNSWGSNENEFPNRAGFGLLQGQDRGVYNEETGKYEYNAVDGAVNTGYFWLSYYDNTISMAEALEFDSVASEAGYYVAEHDYMPVAKISSVISGQPASMANVFCLGDEIDAARLEMVTCETVWPEMDVHIDVYVLDEGWELPTDGRLVSQADEHLRYAGFHKIYLDTPALILRDQYFSIVVTETTESGLWAYNLQLTENKKCNDEFDIGGYAVGIINERESFLYTEGEWGDMSDETAAFLYEIIVGEDVPYFDADNFPIKAYLANPDDGEVPAESGDYKDLDKNAYYYDEVSDAIGNNVVMGTSPETFSPNDVNSRAQAVTWLWRYAGMPGSNLQSSPFRDVHIGDYYYYAVLWAYENGIIKGTLDGSFAPASTVTRAQLAAMLYRYEKLTGGGFNGMWNIYLNYSDVEDIPEYAYEPFCWLTMNKVVCGNGGKLLPQDKCSRAQTVSILQRYFK